METRDKIRLAGDEIALDPDNNLADDFRQTFNIEHKRSAAMSLRRDAAADLTLETKAEDVMLLELQEGVKLIIRRDDFEKDFPTVAASRAATGEMVLPASLPLGSPSRGFKDWAVKVLSVFGVKKAAREASEALVKKFEEGLDPGPGFYRIEQAGKVQLRSSNAVPPDDAPILLFIHGTASSTEGSFGGLWADQPLLVQQLFEHYGQRIYAFEHRTLSESPIENARALLQAIPAGATLHLVSHSRGGLVGELLCRGTVAEGFPAFSEAELKNYSTYAEDKSNAQDNDAIRQKVSKAYATQLNELQALGKELQDKRIKVERFVRVACPARGTTLASGRLDRWLSIMLNLIGLVPVLGQSPYYGLFKSFAIALVESKARPDEIPGLEAQMPDSPLVRLLNSAAQPLAADLSVISGDIEKDSLLGRIALLAPDKFYSGEHDLVVNTASMYGGGERADGERFLYVQGADIHHFSYFRNAATASALVNRLTALPAAVDTIFTPGLPLLTAPIPRSALRASGVPQPVVFIVPGIMGSELSVQRKQVWVDMSRLVFGGMDKLNIKARGVTADGIMASSYARIIDYLAATHEVVIVPFDWRRPLSSQVQGFATLLQAKLTQQQAHDQPLRILAHSMGGLLTRLLMQQEQALWNDIMRHPDARFIMLGTPNAGSYAIPRVLVGQDELIKKLALLDIRNSQAELLDIIRRFPGVLELLPDFGSANADLFNVETWVRIAAASGSRFPIPDKSALDQARDTRTLLNSNPLRNGDREKILYVAGAAPITPIGIDIQADKVVFKGTPRGDGRVSWDSGIPPNINTWYMDALHGDLADHPPAFPALHELLSRGDTELLSRQAPARARGVADVFDMTADEVDMYPNVLDLEKAVMGGEHRIAPAEADKRQVEVVVSHGNLAFARNPVVAGHYIGDSKLFSAERSLDNCLDNQLAERLQLGVYPGALETCAIVMNEPTRMPRGAIVIGLGEVGKLSVARLSATFSYGLRNYGLHIAEQRKWLGPSAAGATGLKISTLLIGSSAGGLPVRDAILAMLKGASSANKAFAETYADGSVFLDQLEFIELFEDAAIHVIDSLHDLAKFEQEVNSQFRLPETLHSIGGGQRRVRFDQPSGWWQRLQITQNPEGELRFNSITDRARTEVNLLATDRKKVDHFLQAATRATYDEPELAYTLFELLLPNELKERAADSANLVLILNEKSARYPWELLADRWARNTRPLAITNGSIRQLESMQYRRNPVEAVNQNAFIVGEPDLWTGVEAGAVDWPRLPGALAEAKLVQQKLVSSVNPFQTETSFNESGFAVLTKLHKKPYRLLHLAGHGAYDFLIEADEGACAACEQPVTKKKLVSGMVIGNQLFLTPADIEQMRNVPELVFINCCHLGNTEDIRDKPSYPSLAASLAVQFIRMGVRAVIAAGWAVNDAAAKTFAGTFYTAMLAGHAFGSAVQSARKATYDNHPGSNTWGAYQCYGDPHYTLTNYQGEHEFSKKSIVAPGELLLELDNIRHREDIRSSKQTEHIAEWLNSLAAQADRNHWVGRGSVCAAFGNAYAELTQLDVAEKWYVRALQAEDADQPLATLEQIAQLKMRRALNTMQKAGTSSKELTPASKELQAAIEILEQAGKQLADVANNTAERLSLLGNAHKLTAQLAVMSNRSPVARLRAMLTTYRAAHDLFTRRNAGDISPRIYANYLTAKFLLHLFDSSKQENLDGAELTALVKLDKDSGPMDSGCRRPGGTADVSLLLHLVTGDLTDHADAIAEGYLNVKQRSSNDFQSLAEEVEFLNAMLTAAESSTQKAGQKGKKKPASSAKNRHGIAQISAHLQEGILQV